MPKTTNYFKELKRRKVFTSAALYAFSAFIIMQVEALIEPAMMLPEWTARLVLILLILGFPIAMILAWIYDRTPEGVMKTDSTDYTNSIVSDKNIPKDANGNSAIVVVNIVDYVKLMNQDEKKAIALIHYKYKIILPFIEKYGGYLIKHIGDGTLCVFSDPAKAVCFSLEILQMWKGISPTKLKVGIHHDNIVFEKGDIFGKGVNFTFRINDLAKSGEIYISKAVYDNVQSRPDIHTTSKGDMPVEEFTDTYEIFSVNIPEKMSVIVRTAGIGKTKKEISKDLTYLTSQWNKIRETTLKAQAPKLIYEEGSILKRTIRDMITEDVESIIVDGKEGFEKVKKLTKNLVPNQTKNIKLYKSKEKTLFSDNNIENQINDLFSLNVKLESGGSIVINTTEALVSIDVNSGKNTSERNIENTALKTNLDAAVEIARQLRLRDLGGLIVIDFIDMDDYRNNFKVEKTLKTALFRDRARIQIGRISMFGLLELSRQRLRSSLIDRSFEKCPYCRGSGLILNPTSISEQIIKI